MSISKPTRLCERLGMNTALQTSCTALGQKPRTSRTCPTRNLCAAWLAVALVTLVFGATAQPTNPPAATNAAPPSETNPQPAAPAKSEAPPPTTSATPTRLDESAFAIIGERNIFNNTRSGGRVSAPNSKRPASVESFTLVGTMAYEKGAFAFFDGSSSEFTKVIKPEGVIAGHKLADILASGVKLEADGKQIELPIGSQMRREDGGTWHLAEAAENHNAGESSGYSSRRNGDNSSRRNGDNSRRDGDSSRRGNNSVTAAKTPSAATPSAAQSEILKRLMERREKE